MKKQQPDDAPTPIRTMEEFAEFVGLSRPTVSKYFRDPNLVRSKTREIIEAAVRSSGFQPNIFAVNLNRRRSAIIGIVMPSHADPFYAELSRRIETIARKAGYLCFSYSSDGMPELEEAAIETFKSLNVAGAIIAPLGIQSHREKLGELGRRIPLVYVDSPLDATTYFVGTNNQQSFGLLVDYLARTGSPPCFFQIPSINYNAVERERAYVDAMRRLGLTPMLVPTPERATWDFEGYGFEETMRIVRADGFPSTTVLCANDRVAFGVLAALFQAGRSVGRERHNDLRVAGHDDQPLARYTCPPLTTAAQNINEIGRLAIEMLLQKIGSPSVMPGMSPDAGRILLNGELTIRASA